MNVQSQEWLSERTGKRINNKIYLYAYTKTDYMIMYLNVYVSESVCVSVYLQKNFNEF